MKEQDVSCAHISQTYTQAIQGCKHACNCSPFSVAYMVKLTGYCYSCWDQNIHKFQTSGIIFSNQNVGYVLVSIHTVCLCDTAGSNCSCVNDNLLVRGDVISWTASLFQRTGFDRFVKYYLMPCSKMWRRHHYR